RAGRLRRARDGAGPSRQLAPAARRRRRSRGRQPRGAPAHGALRAAAAATACATSRRGAAACRPSLHQWIRAYLGRPRTVMNRKGDKALIVGLDIGTSKVVALVGEYSPGNPIEVIGIGSHESRGLKRGV